MIKRSKPEKGNVGEIYVMFKLLRDFNIKSVKVPQEFFSYDLITSNNKRLEVKTATYRDNPRLWKDGRYETGHSYGWEWRKTTKQHEHPHTSDFVVCLGYQSEDFSGEPLCFIVPTEKFWERSNVLRITATSKGKHKWWEYKDRWDLITK
jgi:hypothetical protein